MHLKTGVIVHFLFNIMHVSLLNLIGVQPPHCPIVSILEPHGLRITSHTTRPQKGKCRRVNGATNPLNVRSRSSKSIATVYAPQSDLFG